MKTIQIIRNGHPTKRFLAEERDGVLWVSGRPLLNADRLAEIGIGQAEAVRLQNARQFARLLPAGLCMGDNGNGCVVMDAEEFDRQSIAAERAAREAKARRLSDLFPGLAEIRAAREGEAHNRNSFARAMESEDGASCYRAPYTGPKAEAIEWEHPAAALYLRAESWSCSANDQKVSAGRRAIEKMEAGIPAMLAISAMEAEWSAAAQSAVENS